MLFQGKNFFYHTHIRNALDSDREKNKSIYIYILKSFILLFTILNSRKSQSRGCIWACTLEISLKITGYTRSLYDSPHSEHYLQQWNFLFYLFFCSSFATDRKVGPFCVCLCFYRSDVFLPIAVKSALPNPFFFVFYFLKKYL